MNGQRNLFTADVDPGVPHVAGSKTSRDAGKLARPFVERDRDRVLAYLHFVGSYGATDQELQGALDLRESTERPRRCSLVDEGLVRDSGRTRKTKSGRNAVVWVVA